MVVVVSTLWIYVKNNSIKLVFMAFLVAFFYMYYDLGHRASFTKENSNFLHNDKLDKRVEKMRQTLKSTDTTVTKEIDVIITFTKAKENTNLQDKFRVCVGSMLKESSVTVRFHILGDGDSQFIAENILQSTKHEGKYKLQNHNIEDLTKAMYEIIKPMQTHFSYKPSAYYGDALFFLSIGLHNVLPKTIHKVIMLDSDLKFQADIKQLYNKFIEFEHNNVIGIAREMQPVYRHTFYQYRSHHPGTRVGEPGPIGLTGFNSGVLLLDLDKMRQSKLYNSLISADAVKHLTSKYNFKGHLGDQDFFTLISLDHEELFYIVPCSWNRQLCQWWKDKGYESVWDQYYKCEHHINIYHGNCNTPIP